MTGYRSVTHIALNVSPLEKAEEFYRELFRMEVAFREAETPAGWGTLPDDAGWAEARAAGIELGLSALRRDAFALALEAQAGAGNRLSHIGLEVDSGEMDALRRRARELNCRLMLDRADLIVFQDPYGVQWELTTSTALQSSGDRTGRWLDVKGASSCPATSSWATAPPDSPPSTPFANATNLARSL